MLVDVINNSRSIVELHLSEDRQILREVKFLPHNRVKEYHHKTSDYLRTNNISRTNKNKIALAMAR